MGRYFVSFKNRYRIYSMALTYIVFLLKEKTNFAQLIVLVTPQNLSRVEFYNLTNYLLDKHNFFVNIKVTFIFGIILTVSKHSLRYMTT